MSACNILPRARPDIAPATHCLRPLALLQHPPPLQYYCTYFLSSILHLARATAVYIYSPQLSWQFPLPGRRNFVLVHHYVLVHQSRAPLLSCTNLVHLYSRAPISCTTNLVHHSYLCTSRASLCTHATISCTSTLVHQSHAPPISCTTRSCAQSRRHSEIYRVPTQSNAHPLCVPTLCQLKYMHTHSVCPLCAHSRRHSETCRCPLKYTHTHSVCPLCAHSRRHSETCWCPLKHMHTHSVCPPCAHSRRHSETCWCPLKYTHTHSVCPLCAHSRKHSDDCRGKATQCARPLTSAIAVIDIGHQHTCFHCHSHC